jgi:hypothetical protein
VDPGVTETLDHLSTFIACAVVWHKNLEFIVSLRLHGEQSLAHMDGRLYEEMMTDTKGLVIGVLRILYHFVANGTAKRIFRVILNAEIS